MDTFSLLPHHTEHSWHSIQPPPIRDFPSRSPLSKPRRLQPLSKRTPASCYKTCLCPCFSKIHKPRTLWRHLSRIYDHFSANSIVINACSGCTKPIHYLYKYNLAHWFPAHAISLDMQTAINANRHSKICYDTAYGYPGNAQYVLYCRAARELQRSACHFFRIWTVVPSSLFSRTTQKQHEMHNTVLPTVHIKRYGCNLQTSHHLL